MLGESENLMIDLPCTFCRFATLSVT